MFHIKTIIKILTLNVIAFVFIILLLRNKTISKSSRSEKARDKLIKILQQFENNEDRQGPHGTQKFDDSARFINSTFKEKPTLIIFTTFKAYSPHHALAHRLVILNWASFGDVIRPVLFANLSDLYHHKVSADLFLISNAIENGWDILPLMSTNKFGTPHLKPMYEQIFKRYNASFYGYANGDLLFNEDMVKSLLFLKTTLKTELSNNALLVGRRTDIPLSLNENSSLSLDGNNTDKNFYLEDIKDFEDHFSKSNLTKLTKTGILRGIFAIDYFFFTRDSSTFNWSAIADVVVGRRAYDQYLIAMANRFNVNSIDLSRVVVTAHLSKRGVADTSSLSKDNFYNLDVIGRGFPYNDGLTSTTFYYLSKNVTGNVLVLVKRPPKKPKS